MPLLSAAMDAAVEGVLVGFLAPSEPAEMPLGGPRPPRADSWGPLRALSRAWNLRLRGEAPVVSFREWAVGYRVPRFVRNFGCPGMYEVTMCGAVPWGADMRGRLGIFVANGPWCHTQVHDDFYVCRVCGVQGRWQDLGTIVRFSHVGQVATLPQATGPGRVV